MGKQSKKEELEENIVDMYTKIAFADLGDFLDLERRVEVDENGEEVFSNEVNLKGELLGDTAAIASITASKGSVKVSLYDRMKALEWLTKYYGIGDEIQQAEGGIVIVPDVEKSVREFAQEERRKQNERRTQKEESDSGK